MARRAQTTSPYSGTYDANWQNFYTKGMRSLIPNLCPLVDWLTKAGKKKDRKWAVKHLDPHGSEIYFGTELRLSSGFGYTGEGDRLRSADQVDTVQGHVPYMKGIKGRIGLTWEAMKFGRGGVGVFTDTNKQEAKGAIVMMRKLAQSALWGVGNALLGRVSAGGGGAASTLTMYQTETYNACNPGARWLIDGMKVISCLSTAAYAKDAGCTAAIAVQINSDTAVVSCNPSTHAAANNNVTNDYYLVEHECTNTATAAELAWGSVTLDTASSSRQPQGMLAMCDDGTRVSSYCNISESTYPQWKAVKSHNTGTARSISLDLFNQLYYKLSRKAGSFSMPLTSWTNTDVYRELTKLLQHFVEFKPRSLKPGFEHYDMMIDGQAIPIKLDHECPSYIFFLNPNFIYFVEGQPPTVGKETGSMWRDVADKDDYEAVYRWIFNTFTDSRNKHGILEDLSVTITSL